MGGWSRVADGSNTEQVLLRDQSGSSQPRLNICFRKQWSRATFPAMITYHGPTSQYRRNDHHRIRDPPSTSSVPPKGRLRPVPLGPSPTAGKKGSRCYAVEIICAVIARSGRHGMTRCQGSVRRTRSRTSPQMVAAARH